MEYTTGAAHRMMTALITTWLMTTPACAADRSEAVAPTRGHVVTFDHSHAALNAVLATYVHDGTVDYTGLAQSNALAPYIASLRAIDSLDGWSADQQLALWINAYNAHTLQLIVDNLPVASIRDIGWPLSPWKRKFIGPLGASMTLDDIEHDTIRAHYAEPRIHFALVCASQSCPALRSEAYVADRLDDQLEQQARTFLRDRSKNQITPDQLRLSSIFKWYGADFDSVGGVRSFVASRVDGVADQPIEFLVYDWSLNGQ